MLVSHRKQFIYAKTVKTASTSVESYFEPWCLPEGAWTQSHAREVSVTDAGIIGFRGNQDRRPANVTWWGHMSAAQIRDGVGVETWNRYFKFCVIRNPYDKVISLYYFFLRRQARQSAAQGQPAPEPMSLEAFLGRPGSAAAGDKAHQASMPATDRDKYLIDGEICMDAFVRYESLHEDLAKLCKRFDIPWEPHRMPRFNGGVRPDDVDPRTLYTDEARRMVERRYAYELEHFGYRFPW